MTVAGSLDTTVEALCGDLSSIRAPRGTELHAGSWSTEAPLRMLLNNLDREVAERPEELVVYGVLSVIILLVAWLTGGSLGRALVIVPVFYVIASAWTIQRLRARARREAAKEAE